MKDLVPLLKELIWPAFWGILLLTARAPIRRMLKAVEERIATGVEFEAGPKGIKLGAAPKLAEVPSQPVTPQADLADVKVDASSALNPSDLHLVNADLADVEVDSR